jgi:ornithine carbamoyltransferase
VPVFNGLTDDFHPTQILADLMTMREFTHKHLSDIAFCFMGDAGNNMGSSSDGGRCPDRHGHPPVRPAKLLA